MQNIEGDIADLNPVSLRQPPRRNKGTTAGKTEHLRLPDHAFDPEAIINMGAFDWYRKPLRQLGGAANVINVPMRNENSFDRDRLCQRNRQQPIDIPAGVDDRCTMRLVTPQQRAVLLNPGHRDNLVLQRHSAYPPPKEIRRRVYLSPDIRKQVDQPPRAIA